MPGYKYHVSYAPSGRAQCRKCGKLIAQDSLRISRESGPIEHFGGDAGIINHYHYKHAFDAMEKGRCTSKVVLSKGSLRGFPSLSAKDKKSVEAQIRKFSTKWKKKCSVKKTKKGRVSKKRRSSRKRSSRRSSRRRYSRH